MKVWCCQLFLYITIKSCQIVEFRTKRYTSLQKCVFQHTWSSSYSIWLTFLVFKVIRLHRKDNRRIPSDWFLLTHKPLFFSKSGLHWRMNWCGYLLSFIAIQKHFTGTQEKSCTDHYVENGEIPSEARISQAHFLLIAQSHPCESGNTPCSCSFCAPRPQKVFSYIRTPR